MPCPSLMDQNVSSSSCDHLQAACIWMAGGHACQTLHRYDKCIGVVVTIMHGRQNAACSHHALGTVMHLELVQRGCTPRKHPLALADSWICLTADCLLKLPGQKGPSRSTRSLAAGGVQA